MTTPRGIKRPDDRDWGDLHCSTDTVMRSSSASVQATVYAMVSIGGAGMNPGDECQMRPGRMAPIKLTLRNTGSQIRPSLVDDLTNGRDHHFRLEVIVAGTCHRSVDAIC